MNDLENIFTDDGNVAAVAKFHRDRNEDAHEFAETHTSG